MWISFCGRNHISMYTRIENYEYINANSIVGKIVWKALDN
jgi:hypothetical protein